VASIRVLHLIQHLHGYGAERQVRELLPHLQGDGIVAAAVSVYPSQLNESERQRLGFSAIEIGRKSRLDYTFLPRLIRAIRAFRPDILHAHTHSGKYWGRIAAWIAGVKVVVFTEHNPCDPRRSYVQRLADPLLHAKTTRIITFLGEQRKVLSAIDRTNPRKIVIIPNGIAPSVLQPDARFRARNALDLSETELGVFLVGRLTLQKNQQLALRALALVPPALRKRIRLFIAGAGNDEVMLRGLSRSLEIEESVRFLGYRSDLPLLVHGADLLLMTSLFEGMPITLIEAMHAHIPILTTPWTGAAEMLGQGRYGFLASHWSPADVAEALVYALNNERARAEIAERAYDYAVEALHVARTAQAHRRLYRELTAIGAA
jgi:glycosyltransferase involved in cell wall biosynthesis